MTQLATYKPNQDYRPDSPYKSSNFYDFDVSSEPRVAYDVTLGTLVGLASLVSFSPCSSSDPTESFSTLFGLVTPTVVREIDKPVVFEFKTPIVGERGGVVEPAVYVEFLEDFDSAEIELFHLDASSTYGW